MAATNLYTMYRAGVKVCNINTKNFCHKSNYLSNN